MKVNSVLEVIGKTPLVKLNKIFGSDVEVWMKLERQNPGGSIKDRIALAMIEAAEKEGKINKEIADTLCIGLSTVITHRKNIQEKLGLKSVSSLTIYAVMHGYVDINKI